MPARCPAGPACAPRLPRYLAGFTLVELMVVLAVVGLLGAVVLLTAPAPDAALRRDAETLATRLAQAQQEAILSTRALRVQADAGGYRFLVARSGGWQPLSGPPFEPATWAPGITPVLDGGDQPVWFAFDPIGTAEPVSLMLGDGTGTMQVRVDAAGGVRVAQAP